MNFATSFSMLSVVCHAGVAILLIDVHPDIVTSQSSTLGWKVDDVKNMMKLTNGFSSESGLGICYIPAT
jgi:hypothetical protein